MQNKSASVLVERLAVGGELPGPVLIVAAHPDDESIGAGARFARLGERPAFVHVTDGSPRDLSDARRAGFACYHQPADGGFVLGDFLPTDGAPAVWTAPLSDAERQRKRRVLAAHHSQWHLLQGWPLDCERFRAAPDYDFTRPAHPDWPPLYEKFGWGGMTAVRWCALTTEALAELGLLGRDAPPGRP